MNEYISREAVLSKCQQIWNDADETAEIGVAIINIAIYRRIIYAKIDTD